MAFNQTTVITAFTLAELTTWVSMMSGSFPTLAVSGTAAVGGALDASAGLAVLNTGLTGTSQYGIKNTATASAAATAALYGSYTSVTTFAGVNTTTNVYGAYIATPTKGTGSTITNRYGLYVESVTGGGTLNYGIYVAGGTPAIYVAAGGLQVVGGGYSDGSQAPLAYAGLIMSSTRTLSGGTSQYSAILGNMFGSGATVAGYGLFVGSATTDAVFTMTTQYGIFISSAAKGAQSTITNRYGLYVVCPTDGGTLNVGVALTGAAAATASLSSVGGNVVIGGTVAGATSVNTLCFGATGGTSPSATADMVHLYGLDISAGHRSLAIWSEEVVNAGIAVASTHRLPITINGVQYAILLTTVLA